MCSLIVKEVIHYYIDNKSDVYSCCVDATKAFDRVHHDRLFQLLIEHKVPAIALQALLDMYERQSMRTMWKEEFSELFTTTLRKDFVILQLYWWLFSSTKHCS